MTGVSIQPTLQYSQRMAALEKADNWGFHKFVGLLPKAEEMSQCSERPFSDQPRMFPTLSIGWIKVQKSEMV